MSEYRRPTKQVRLPGGDKKSLPVEVAEKIRRDAKRFGLEATTIISLALSKFYEDHPNGIQLS